MNLKSKDWRPEIYVPFQVVTSIPARVSNVQFTIVTEYDNILDLWDAIREDGGVFAARLMLAPDDGGEMRRIRGAQPFVLGKAITGTIAPPHFVLDPADLERVLQDFDWGYELT